MDRQGRSTSRGSRIHSDARRPHREFGPEGEEVGVSSRGGRKHKSVCPQNSALKAGLESGAIAQPAAKAGDAGDRPFWLQTDTVAVFDVPRKAQISQKLSAKSPHDSPRPARRMRGRRQTLSGEPAAGPLQRQACARPIQQSQRKYFAVIVMQNGEIPTLHKPERLLPPSACPLDSP